MTCKKYCTRKKQFHLLTQILRVLLYYSTIHRHEVEDGHEDMTLHPTRYFSEFFYGNLFGRNM